MVVIGRADYADLLTTGVNGSKVSRNQIHITSSDGIDDSFAALHKCLSRNDTNALFRGCMPEKTDYVFVSSNSSTSSSKWPPDDPGQYVTKVDFTVEWAKKLSGFKTLADLQRAAGTKGMISERHLDNEHPSVSYHWRSEPNAARIGYMLATVYQDGGVGVSILTDEDIEIVVNNFGAFICDKCSPPIDKRGAEPSWAK
jgi:hypothetical protein